MMRSSAVAAVAVLALVAAACGGDDDEGDAAATSTASTANIGRDVDREHRPGRPAPIRVRPTRARRATAHWRSRCASGTPPTSTSGASVTCPASNGCPVHHRPGQRGRRRWRLARRVRDQADQPDTARSGRGAARRAGAPRRRCRRAARPTLLRLRPAVARGDERGGAGAVRDRDRDHAARPEPWLVPGDASTIACKPRRPPSSRPSRVSRRA